MWAALRATDNRTANCTLILPPGVECQFCWARTAHQRRVRRRVSESEFLLPLVPRETGRPDLLVQLSQNHLKMTALAASSEVSTISSDVPLQPSQPIGK